MYDVYRFIILFCKDICAYKAGMKEEIHVLKVYTGNGSLSPRRYTFVAYIHIYICTHTKYSNFIILYEKTNSLSR